MTQPPSIEQFQAPKSRTPWRLLLLTIALVVATAVLATVTFLRPECTTMPTTTAPNPTSTRSVGPRGSLWMSEPRQSNGYWEITSETWTTDGLVLGIHMECDEGGMPLQFFVIANSNASDQFSAERGSSVRQPNLQNATIAAGQRIDGYVTVRMPRQAATLIMGSSARQPVSGLLING